MSSPAPADIAAELQRVLGSRVFSRTRRLHAFLAHIVNAKIEGNASKLRETSIALDVFARDPARFDSSDDGIVRVYATRLRGALDRYYADEGRGATLRIELAPGSYAPVVRRRAPTHLPPLPRIAVLPHVNLTGNADNEALCDGLTEDLIDALGRRRDLRVTARTSTARYKNVAGDIRQIARELDVDALLEGSVYVVDGRLRVTAQMILGSDGTHLWSQAFDEQMGDRDSLQRRLVEHVVRLLEVDADNAIAAAPATAAARAPTPTEQSGLDGIEVALRDRSAVSNAHAVELATTFTANHPDIAQGWGLLARAIVLRIQLADVPPRALIARARVAVERALALDAGQCDALAARAVLTAFVDRDLAAARESLKALVEARPARTDLHLVLAGVCLFAGDFAEALRILDVAIHRDPHNLHALSLRAYARAFARDYAGARADWDAVLAIPLPSHVNCYLASYNERWNGSPLRALNLVDTAIALEPEITLQGQFARAAALLACGRRDEGLATRDATLTTRRDEFASPYHHAVVAALLRDKAQTLEWLRRSADAGEIAFCASGVDPSFEFLADDPEFDAFLREYGLPGSRVRKAGSRGVYMGAC